MSIYANARVTVPDRVVEFHAEEIESFSRPGTWLTGEERLAIVECARDACAARGWSPGQNRVGAPPADVLPAASLRVIEKLAVDAREFVRDDFEAACAAGMGFGEYVETVSLVSRVVNVDVFARGVGAPPPALRPAMDGEPTFVLPTTAAEGAWLETVPAGSAGGLDALEAYGNDGPQPFIYRALSQVPAEAHRCIVGGDLQYLPLEKFMDFSYSHLAGLTRVQVEIVAARISALNDCFY